MNRHQAELGGGRRFPISCQLIKCIYALLSPAIVGSWPELRKQNSGQAAALAMADEEEPQGIRHLFQRQ